MGPEAAARACRFLEARRVIPIHWKTFPILTGTPQELESMLTELGGRTEVVALQPGESF
jgi:L-ascorbate metabolism protein UlaG (beta-lactamase superfamily)